MDTITVRYTVDGEEKEFTCPADAESIFLEDALDSEAINEIASQLAVAWGLVWEVEPCRST